MDSAAYLLLVSQQQAAIANAYQQQVGDPYAQYNAALQQSQSQPQNIQKEPDVSNPNELLPDISITRVMKWAFVLLVAMALGKKVWGLFGDKITKQMHKALGEIAE